MHELIKIKCIVLGFIGLSVEKKNSHINVNKLLDMLLHVKKKKKKKDIYLFTDSLQHLFI